MPINLLKDNAINQGINNVQKEPINLLDQRNFKPQINKYARNNPLAFKLAEYTSKNPNLAAFIERAAEPAESINRFVENIGLPEIAPSFLEGVGNSGISLANLALKPYNLATGKDVRIPHSKIMDTFFPERTGIVSTAANIAGQFYPAAGANAILRESMRPQGLMGFVKDILQGAGLGYALGENEYGERLPSALIGGAFGGVSGLGNKVIADRVNTFTKNLRNEFQQSYQGLFKKAIDSGIEKVKYPNITPSNLNKIKKISSDTGTALERFHQNPSVENAHLAQSDLGKLISKIEHDIKKGGVSSERNLALKAAKDADKRINGSIYTAFQKANRPDLAKEYAEITKDYAERGIPFLHNPDIHLYDITKKKPGTLVKNLRENEPFSLSQGKNYPELEAKKYLDYLTKVGIFGGSGLGSGYLGTMAYDKFVRNK